MSVLHWWTQRIGALSTIALLGLSYYVISQAATIKPSVEHANDDKDIEDPHSLSTNASTLGSIWVFVFAYYSLFIHVLVTFFPIRSCWAIWELTNILKSDARNRKKGWSLRSKRAYELAKLMERPAESRSSEETLHEEESLPSLTLDGCAVDLGNLLEPFSGQYDSVVHAIIIPNYKEDEEILRETLDVLASHPRARTCYDVYLGMEAREADGAAKALRLIQLFAKDFRSINFTSHPGDIPGEAAGKGSNQAWVARRLSEKYAMETRSRVVVTGIDADSHLSAKYFNTIAEMHLAHPETADSTLYVAPIVFDRNASKIAGIVRVADILWCAAGISGLYQGSAISPPTSVYSLPLTLVDRVGGWDCDSEAIGEDLHMYLKCFFALNGNLTCRAVPVPISSSNVCGNGKGGIRGTVSDIQARYKQAVRHMWGALDTGYAIRAGVKMWRTRWQTTTCFQPLHRSSGDGLTAFVPATSTTASDENVDQSGIFSEITQVTMPEAHWENIFYLYLRLFEAHFLPIHMAILVFASGAYLWAMDGKEDINNLLWTFQLSRVCRTFGLMMVGVFMFSYESYHRVAVTTRQEDMMKAGLAEGMDFAHRSFKKNFVDYLLIPVVAPVFGTVPSFQAVMSHMWTTDLVYTVSKKTARQRIERADAGEMA